MEERTGEPRSVSRQGRRLKIDRALRTIYSAVILTITSPYSNREYTAMRIEHVALQVADPATAGDWYCAHLGFQIARASNAPVPVRFLADESGSVMLEIYNNPAVVPPDYASMDPLLLHVAFVCDDVSSTARRLVDAGATLISGPETIASGDELAMLRDPWGLALQLCKRAEPMV